MLRKSNSFTEEIVKSTIELYEPESIENQLRDCNRKIRQLGILRRQFSKDKALEAKIQYEYNLPRLIGGKEEQWESEYQNRKAQLEKEKEFLKQYGALEREVCHEVGDILLHDWDMELEESLETEGKVKELS